MKRRSPFGAEEPIPKLVTPALYALACLAVLAGCGSDSDTSESGSDDDTLFQAVKLAESM